MAGHLLLLGTIGVLLSNPAALGPLLLALSVISLVVTLAWILKPELAHRLAPAPLAYYCAYVLNTLTSFVGRWRSPAASETLAAPEPGPVRPLRRLSVGSTTLDNLDALIDSGEYLSVIAAVKHFVKEDRSAFTHPAIRRWCGLRWRALFVSASIADPVAMKAAARPPGYLGWLFGWSDSRPAAQQAAERYLKSDARREWVHVVGHAGTPKMPPPQVSPSYSNTTLLFCPGLLNGLLPVAAFYPALPEVEASAGIRVLRSDSHPLRGCRDNVSDILAALAKGHGQDAACKPVESSPPPKDVVIVCYSKGGPDMLTALCHHPEIVPRVRAMYLWAGAVGGSYLADDVYNTIKGCNLE
jgi:hypothetical protein